MVQRTPTALAALYTSDEVAYLETTASILRDRLFDQIDPETLAEFLTDKANRERREMRSRLIVLIAHLLKWDYQPERRTTSWTLTILEQQGELSQILESGTLRNLAAAGLADAYAQACRRAAAETGLPRSTFPAECPWGVDALLADTTADDAAAE
ncbi:MAG: DUF29 domain-containing protein [Fimbriiglobus sp.]